MDPLTHGLLGATAAQGVSGGKQLRLAAFAGAAAGMVPDLDILIQSETEPLLYIEYHRHFTHSLAMAPLIGLIVGSLFWLALRKRPGFSALFLFATTGALTHGLLDACTSYGTHLFWPFSDGRVAWNIVAVVDPLFTVPLAIFCLLAFVRRKSILAWMGIGWALFYLGFGMFQQQRAEAVLVAVAEDRGHVPERIEVRPTILNNVLWRGVYEAGGRIYTDGIHVGWLPGVRVYRGESAGIFVMERDLPDLDPDSVLAGDIERFDYFSEGFLGFHLDKPGVLGDLRYSFLPNRIQPLWGIYVDLDKPDEHVPFEHFRDVDEKTRSRFFRMVFGRDLAEDR